MAVKIDLELCVGCGCCEGSCPNSAVEIADGKAKVKDNCTGCGLCIGACPVSAISADAGSHEMNGNAESRGIWVFCQQMQAELLSVSFELVSKARELADVCGETVTAVVFGQDVWGLDELIKYGADKVIYAEDKLLSYPLEIPYSGLLCDLIRKRKPSVVLYPATPFGRTMAPMVAAELKTGLTADCTVLETDEETGLLRQTRPAFGGNLMATIVCENTRPQMATVRPGVFPAGKKDPARPGSVEYMLHPALRDAGLRILSFENRGTSRKITDSEVLVVAGRGIGSKKNLAVVKELAGLLGGDFGVSRPLVDEGWADYSHQVGQTGSSVSPKLLISLGVSGAIQHLAGIGGAQTVIAVNTDPDAPIFSAADYAVTCDCIEFAKEMIEILKSKKS